MRGGMAPTARQMTVLIHVAKSIAARGIAPTVRELCAAIGVRSTNAVSELLRRLEDRGLVTFRGPAQMARRIALTDAGIALVGVAAPKNRFELPALPHVTIGASRCGQCGATTFAPEKPCVICRVIAEKAA